MLADVADLLRHKERVLRRLDYAGAEKERESAVAKADIANLKLLNIAHYLETKQDVQDSQDGNLIQILSFPYIL